MLSPLVLQHQAIDIELKQISQFYLSCDPLCLRPDFLDLGWLNQKIGLSLGLAAKLRLFILAISLNQLLQTTDFADGSPQFPLQLCYLIGPLLYIPTNSLLTFLKNGHLLLRPFQSHLIPNLLDIHIPLPIAIIPHLILTSLQILQQLLIALTPHAQMLVQLPPIYLCLSLHHHFYIPLQLL